MTSRFVPPRNAALDDEGRDRHSGSNGAPTAVVLYEVTPSDEIRVRLADGDVLGTVSGVLPGAGA